MYFIKIIAFFLASVTSSYAQQSHLEIKGLYLGMTEKQLITLYPWLRCYSTTGRSAAFYDSTCTGAPRLGDQEFTLGFSKASLTAEIRDGGLVRVDVMTDEVGSREAIRGALEKYGKITPYMIAEVTLFGEKCIVSRYLWKNIEGGEDALYMDQNFPRCGGGSALLVKNVARRTTKPDI